MGSTTKAFLAVFLGIYLVLPSCLCQLLCAVGVAPLPVDSGAETRLVCTDFSPHICHCHDHTSKVAEVVPTHENIDPAPSLSPVQASVFSSIFAPEAIMVARPRPPPCLAASASARAAQLGVFLI